METPEQTEARCARLAMERAAKLMETPEQVAARRAFEKERKRQSTTPEQFAARRARDAETRRKRIQAQRSTETPEERAARLRKQNEQFKKRREKMVQEQAAARQERREIQEKEIQQYKERVAKQASKQTKRRKRHKNETSEERVARLRKHNENIKTYREKKQAVETSEETATRKAKTTQLQTLRRALETSDKSAARLQTARENRRKYLAKRKEERQAMTAKNSTAVAHGDLIGSKTWSSFGTAESSSSITAKTIGESFSISTKDDPVEQYPKGNILIKNELSQDSWSYGQAKLVTKEPFQDDRDVELSKDGYKYSKSEYKVIASNDVKVERDGHFMYGAYIADRFRKCKRNVTEVNFAKNHIESIFLDLSAGAFSYTSSVGKNDIDQADEAPSLLKSDISRPFEQDIIVKEEVHI